MSNTIQAGNSALALSLDCKSIAVQEDFRVTRNDKFTKLTEILFEEINKLDLLNIKVHKTYNPNSHVSDLVIKVYDMNKNDADEVFVFRLNLDALRQNMLIRYGIERKLEFSKDKTLGLIVCPFPLKAYAIRDYFRDFLKTFS